MTERSACITIENSAGTTKEHSTGITREHSVGTTGEHSADTTREHSAGIARECSLCHKEVDISLVLVCKKCQAVYYCSDVCLNDDKVRGDNYHSKWCDKLKKYMEIETADLRCLPFTFTDETTSEDFDDDKYKCFLQSHGVYNYGCWRRECTLWGQNGGLPPCGSYLNFDNPYILPVESCTLEEDVCQPVTDVKDWMSYSKHREISLDSPVAILLQWPLTLYHVFINLAPDCYATLKQTRDDSSWKVDIVGVDQEVELLPVFEELGKLLPDHFIDIHMFGINISTKVDGLRKEFHNIHITVHKMLYHKAAAGHRRPDMVLGYNAGIAAYVTWMETIKLLKERKIPAFFTDYCLQSVEISRTMILDVLNIKTSTPVLNPFHSPVRVHSRDQRLPKFSNAYIYHLIYD